jgi:hypothetical protein
MRLLREPLLHFVLLGALIFAVFAARGERGRSRPDRIVVGAGQIEHLADGFARTWQRPPTSAELDGLVDDYVREEIYYREAMVLGLERDDTVVRRRLRQKMEFLVEDVTAGSAPSDADLEAYLRAHPDGFRIEPELTLRQVYVSRDRRGERVGDDARSLLARLTDAGPDAAIDDLGDALMVPHELSGASRSEVARVFGDDFAAAVADLPIGRWTGPVASGFGLHLVLLRARTAGRVPALDEVREAVARELQATNRKQMVESAYAALRARYEVVVEHPTGDAVATR